MTKGEWWRRKRGKEERILLEGDVIYLDEEGGIRKLLVKEILAFVNG